MNWYILGHLKNGHLLTFMFLYLSLGNSIKHKICHLVYFTNSSTMTVMRLSNYTNFHYLGQGSQATVYSAVNRSTNKKVAIKMYASSSMGGFLQEVRVLRRNQKLNLKHSIQLIESFIEKDKLFIVLEFVTGVELHDFITSEQLTTKNDIKSLFKQILLAVYELHENSICHLDIKLENIMIDVTSKEIKLIDFGFSNFTDANQDKEKLQTKFCGSIHYSSPEIIRNVPYSGKKADIWSLGILLFVLIEEKFPFGGNDDTNAVAHQIIRDQPDYSSRFSSQTIQFIELMLHKNPSKRPEIKTLLQHSWFSGL